MLQESLQDAQQRLPFHRFGREIRAPSGNAALAVAGHGVGGQRHDGLLVADPAQFAGGLVAVHDWHLHVHQHEVKRRLRALGGERHGHRAAAIGHDGDLRAKLVQQVGDEALVVGAVFGDQDAAAQMVWHGPVLRCCATAAGYRARWRRLEQRFDHRHAVQIARIDGEGERTA